MLHESIELLREDITQLPYVQRYGGLVIKAKRVELLENGMKIECTYPVACGVSFIDCFSGPTKYLDMIPNSNYTSIFYWEVLKWPTINLSKQGLKGNLKQFDAQVRLVGWLNLAKLGMLDQCSIAGQISSNLCDVIDGAYQFENSPFHAGGFQISFARLIGKEPDILFGEYSYSEAVKKCLLGPYEFFGMDFNMAIRINPKCVDQFTVGTPVECINLGI